MFPLTLFIFSSKVTCPSPFAVPHKAIMISVASTEFLLGPMTPKSKTQYRKPQGYSEPGLFTLRITFCVPVSVFCQYPQIWALQGRKRVEQMFITAKLSGQNTFPPAEDVIFEMAGKI